MSVEDKIIEYLYHKYHLFDITVTNMNLVHIKLCHWELKLEIRLYFRL